MVIIIKSINSELNQVVNKKTSTIHDINDSNIDIINNLISYWDNTYESHFILESEKSELHNGEIDFEILYNFNNINIINEIDILDIDCPLHIDNDNIRNNVQNFIETFKLWVHSQDMEIQKLTENI